MLLTKQQHHPQNKNWYFQRPRAKATAAQNVTNISVMPVL